MLEIIIGVLILVVINNWILIINSLIFYLIFLLLKIYDEGEYLVKLIIIILRVWLTIMILMSIKRNIKKFDLYIVFIFILFSLLLVFYCERILIFYLGFEIRVIPILLIIFGWGYQPDRLEAGMYIILYTVFFSLPLLIGIFYITYNYIMKTFLFYFIFIIAFLVKFPIFGLHLWLPRAHVEAPVFGSIILAGVILKLGGYGIVKISFVIGDLVYFNSYYIIILSVLGGLILRGICFTQRDIKILVAYSSIVHIRVVLSGLLTLRETGINGGIYLIIGHGLCSSGLFCILGMTYDRTLSRRLYLNKGIIILIPSCSLWWFLFCSSNLSFPPCLNLPGEILLFIRILRWRNSIFIIIGVLGLLRAIYRIYLFSFSQQGICLNYYNFCSFKIKELLIMFLHWVPLNLLILDLRLITFY